jgi:hypothetical protein
VTSSCRTKIPWGPGHDTHDEVNAEVNGEGNAKDPRPEAHRLIEGLILAAQAQRLLSTTMSGASPW